MGTNIKFKPTGEGEVDKLLVQLVNVMKNCNQESKPTRWRYYHGMKPFLRFVAYEFKLQNIKKISQKHIDAYIQHRKGLWKCSNPKTAQRVKQACDKTIKGDLSAIRFWHRQIPGAKYKLDDNDIINKRLPKDAALGSTPENKKQDKSWTDEEVTQMVDLARKLGRDNIADAILLMRYTGLRIHEAHKIDKAAAARYLRKLTIDIKGKGGKVRTFGIAPGVKAEDGCMLLHTKETKELLSKLLKKAPKGQKLFSEPGKNQRDMQMAVIDFIKRHRDKIQGDDIKEGKRCKLTAHGLRHTKMRDEYALRLLTAPRGSLKNIKTQVSRIAGHYRSKVTNVYLGPLGRYRLKAQVLKSNEFAESVKRIRSSMASTSKEPQE